MSRHPELLQHPTTGRTGRTPRTARLVRDVGLAAGLALLPLVAACSGGAGGAAAGSEPSKVSATPAAGAVAPAKVEVIADLTGCKAKIRTDADELREGVCHTGKGDYLITTFPEEKYKETWLESAALYGGRYLVGSRWVVSAKPAMLEHLRSRLGGTIQQLRGMGPTGAPSGS
ncbi:hypothetical protein [Streptomyces sp. S.PNR 29]|uniref:hypothetical protein n=1 Tax=Streptomyces sp. S.PNR 29 TaxID=2973805 RepID=UPI0025AFCA89|nr:hypothetical protein [Streptomyces sp. S.PNR 29]MDN0197638.1 hypothetical protein [Streptomyces sp. S.PNR 29]